MSAAPQMASHAAPARRYGLNLGGHLPVLPPSVPQPHSQAWMAQTWIAFVVSTVATGIGIWVLPVEPWIRGYLAVGMLFVVQATLALSKTVRDQHEAGKTIARVDEARVEQLLTQTD